VNAGVAFFLLAEIFAVRWVAVNTGVAFVLLAEIFAVRWIAVNTGVAFDRGSWLLG
jgi:hypothetical protein